MSHAYLHGYSGAERARLRTQAKGLGRWVHRDLPFARSRSLVEVGCGAGAQLELLLDAFPRLSVTGVDRAADQIDAARALLAPFGARARLVEAPGERLPFDAAAFDAGFVCWVLEHVADPAPILAELHRVLEPGAPLVITEVMNATFHLDPPAPAVMRYWDAFNRHQLAIGGDPYAGARLGGGLHRAGFRDVELRLGDVILDDRDPAGRAEICRLCGELLLSAAPQLVAAGRVGPADVDAMCGELDALAGAPGAVFFYVFVQARARR